MAGLHCSVETVITEEGQKNFKKRTLDLENTEKNVCKIQHAFGVCTCTLNHRMNTACTSQNNGENKQHNIRLSVCFSTILEFHNKWLLCLCNYCIHIMKISSRYYKSLQMLRSSGNRHTHRHTN